jgi:hypothetical protein
MVRVWVPASSPWGWWGRDEEDWFSVLGLISKNHSHASRKERPFFPQSSAPGTMGSSCLWAGAIQCNWNSSAGWGTVPRPCHSCCNLDKSGSIHIWLLAVEGLQKIRDVWRIKADTSCQTSVVPGNVGTSNVRNMVRTGNGFPSLFLINLYTLDEDWSARPISISSCLNSTRESVLRSSLEELTDACGSTWMGYEARIGFQDGLCLFLTMHVHQKHATVYVRHVLSWHCLQLHPHGCYCHALVITSSFSHIEHCTSVSSPLVFTLVLLFTLTAHLDSFW